VIQGVAYYEVVLIPLALILGVFPRWVGITTPIIYFMFLRTRYLQSSTIKRAFKAVRIQADKYLDVPSVPAGVRSGYLKARDTLEKLGGQERAAETPQGAAAGATAGAAGASEGVKKD
jgi:hypothetical protein